jgi:copper chaperone
MSIELNVTGMTCGHCKAAVEGALSRLEGVKAVQVSLEQGRAVIEGEHLELSALIAAVAEEGYGAQIAGA